MAPLCHEDLENLQNVFGDEENNASLILEHGDFSAAKIIVYPETSKITLLFDCETINTIWEKESANTPCSRNR